MLHCGNVENCEDTSAGMVERGKINWKGRTYCVARAPNDISYKINTHIPDISIHYFLRGVAVWPQWTRSRRNRGDFTIQCSWPRAPYRCYSGFWTSYPSPSKSASEYGPPPPVQICQRIWTPPPPIKLSFWAAFVLYLVIIIFWGGGVKSAEDHFSPPTSGSRDLRNCFASQISHAKHHLFPGSSEKIPVSDGNDRQLLCWAHSRTRTQKSFNCFALSDF